MSILGAAKDGNLFLLFLSYRRTIFFQRGRDNATGQKATFSSVLNNAPKKLHSEATVLAARSPPHGVGGNLAIRAPPPQLKGPANSNARLTTPPKRARPSLSFHARTSKDKNPTAHATRPRV